MTNIVRASRQARYLNLIESMTDDRLAEEIAELEDINPRAKSFDSWALRQAEAELDHRL